MASPFRLVKLIDPITVIPNGLVPRGAYNNGTDYAVGDSVSYGGSSYVMYADAGAGTLPTDTTKWQLLAAGGVVSAGLPVGGSTGQILAKVSGTDYDAGWIDNTSIPMAIALG